LIVVNAEGTFFIRVLFPGSLLSKISSLTSQCFGYTKEHKRCKLCRRDTIGGKGWCHWHLNQASELQSSLDNQFFSESSFLPKWWET
jgi:hypothetical protein